MMQLPWKMGILCCFLLWLLTGCEGARCGKGEVRDAATNQPLDSVYCRVVTGLDKTYTDTHGSFEVCNRMGSCMGGCKDILVEFSKPGYNTERRENEACNGIVYLKK